ncbi:MAG: tetrahydromethanopterin S-methyltransferase subunit D [Candidatus Methanoperedens sp.]|nr:tetrahydromethanopterin S-methyltransferase subunit D [Candidatus Methanoperedens sp.]CAG0957460.1 tetrahydromethanopterin S-methyltransferase subunit D [Methanosarcinales archaeon]
MVAIDPTLLTNILLIGLSGTLICLAVHFIPVGGAPAAMAQATGIGTGTVELAAGSGLVGLITASYMYAYEPLADIPLVMAAGAMGSMVMLASTMFAGSLIYAYGVAVPFASAQVKKDPITGDRQDTYISKGTQGQGLPTICYVSGVVGAALGGAGGGLIYFVLMDLYKPYLALTSAFAVAGVFTMGVMYVNSVIPSYGVGGTIEGIHDPKFRRVVGKDVITSFFVSILCGLLAVLIAGGMSV